MDVSSSLSFIHCSPDYDDIPYQNNLSGIYPLNKKYCRKEKGYGGRKKRNTQNSYIEIEVSK